MCLAIPAKIISVECDMAEADIGGVTRQVSLALTPEVEIGDYVLLHAGFALSVIDAEEAQETLKMLESLI
ncbi:MAG: HypC/HybG/HupF family hydrogenase formation chaperone [Dehalococcoidia bacterium]|nr:HypC/HybG/HupF family hydrogenase formation chaperone [Dehalococcoidia bacterium]